MKQIKVVNYIFDSTYNYKNLSYSMQSRGLIFLKRNIDIISLIKYNRFPQ